MHLDVMPRHTLNMRDLIKFKDKHGFCLCCTFFFFVFLFSGLLRYNHAWQKKHLHVVKSYVTHCCDENVSDLPVQINAKSITVQFLSGCNGVLVGCFLPKSKDSTFKFLWYSGLYISLCSSFSGSLWHCFIDRHAKTISLITLKSNKMM